MLIYVVTNGMYEERVIGVATSPGMADAMIAKAQRSGEFSDRDYDVKGPFEPGDVINWKCEVI